MREFKGTPGPWRSFFNGSFIDITPHGETQSLAIIVDNKYLPGNHKSNANLIAAAPGLLEASIKVLQGFEGGITDELYNYSRLIELQKAVNKALGIPTNSTHPDTQREIEEAFNKQD